MPRTSSPKTSGVLKSRHDVITDLDVLTERCRQGLSSRVPRITWHVLKATRPAENGKSVFIGTSELACFYIRITPNGHASYCVQHRACGRRTIGDVRTLTMKDALARGREILTAAIVDGLDLVAHEQAAAAARKVCEANTCKALFTRYLDLPEVRAERSYRQKHRYLTQEKYWGAIHEENAETVDGDTVWRVLQQIAKRGGPTANHARSILAATFNAAISRRWLKRATSPTLGLHRWEQRARTRYFSREELPRLWHAGPRVNAGLGDTIKLMLLTGCRRNEIARASLSEVNFDEAQLELPAERCKNGLPHIVPLSPAALAIFERWRPLASETGRFFPRVNEDKVKKELDRRVDFAEPYVIEDCRRTFATGLREWLKPAPDEPLVDLLMNHVQGATAARCGSRGVYNRVQRLDDRRRVLEAWALWLQRLVGEGEAADVIRLPGASR